MVSEREYSSNFKYPCITLEGDGILQKAGTACDSGVCWAGCSLQSFYKKQHYHGKCRVTFIQDIKWRTRRHLQEHNAEMTQTKGGVLHIWTRYFARIPGENSPHLKGNQAGLHCNWLPPCFHLHKGQAFCISKTFTSPQALCVFFISASLPSISSLWPSWFMLSFSNDKVHLFAFLGSWTAKKDATKTVARLKGGNREDREVSSPAQMNAITKANTAAW